mmetsp:Transcript_43361/g.99920  ORF Transcript_43361/g.99920 Transcript_43361/m.99920 type:complete len:242 (+) Transcript_43361:1726-2451(+)
MLLGSCRRCRSVHQLHLSHRYKLDCVCHDAINSLTKGSHVTLLVSFQIDVPTRVRCYKDTEYGRLQSLLFHVCCLVQQLDDYLLLRSSHACVPQLWVFVCWHYECFPCFLLLLFMQLSIRYDERIEVIIWEGDTFLLHLSISFFQPVQEVTTIHSSRTNFSLLLTRSDVSSDFFQLSPPLFLVAPNLVKPFLTWICYIKVYEPVKVFVFFITTGSPLLSFKLIEVGDVRPEFFPLALCSWS